MESQSVLVSANRLLSAAVLPLQSGSELARRIAPVACRRRSAHCHQDILPKRSFHCRSRLRCATVVQKARSLCWWLSNYRCRDCISRRYSASRWYCCRPRRPSHRPSTLPCDNLGQSAHWWCWSLSNYRCPDCIFHRYSRSVRSHRKKTRPR